MSLYNKLPLSRLPHITALLLCLWVLSACQTENSSVQTRLKLAGSTTVEPVARDLATIYMLDHPDAYITIRAGGSTIGIKGAGYEAVNIGMSSRSLRNSEVQKWPDLQTTVIARDGVAVVINKFLYDAGVQALSFEQIAGIWRGKITNWQEVGGPDADIVVFDKELLSGTRNIFASVVLGDGDAPAPGADAQIRTNEDSVAVILEEPLGISIMSVAWQTDTVVGVAIINEQGEAIEPTTDNVVNGSYPITRNLNFVTNGEPIGLEADFLAFVLSEKGQQVVRDDGYIPVR